MTDSPINLDEGKALRSKIDVLPLDVFDEGIGSCPIWASDGDLVAEVHNNLGRDTYRYDLAKFLAWAANNFDAMHDELVDARERIAELDTRCNDLLDRNDWLRKTLDDSPYPELRMEIAGLTNKLFCLKNGEFWKALNRIGVIPDETNDQIICDLETKCQYQEGEIVEQKRQIDELKGILLKAIIPQAEDAKCLADISYFLEENDQLLPFPNQGLENAKALIKRYLTAIEGGKL